jgi:ADP-heptose:LPS heptosyltransferase
MKYLIFFDATLGNFTHLIHILVLLKRKNIDFTLLVLNSEVNELAKNFDLSKKIIFFKKRNYFFLNYFFILKLILFLNKKNYDCLINLSLHNQWKNILFNKLLTIKKKYLFSFNKLEKKNSELNYIFYNNKLSESKNYINLFQNVFKKKFAINIFRFKKSKKNIIGIHAGSSRLLSYKRWHKTNFSLLIKKLIKCDYNIFLFGKGKEEEEINNFIFDQLKSKKIYNFTNKLNFKKLIFKIRNCRLILSNDSGIMQLSALCNVPTVGLFGPTSEIKNSPNNKNFYPVRFFSKKNCNKFTNEICKNCRLNEKFKLQPKCLISINVNFVYRKILKYLK